MTLHAAEASRRSAPPNIVVIFADDLGYGDLGCYGHPSIRTPHLDRLAANGVRFTDFYSAAEVCTPSRAALLTGRYAIRSGMCSDNRRVLFPESKGGLPPEEITLAEVLREKGYATAHVGKWHLGIHAGSRPIDQGFDLSIEVPYSNDMDRRADLPRQTAGLENPPADGWNVPLLRNGEVIERPVDQTTLTRRFTDAAVRFIDENRDRPFFLYFAHTFPHVPLFASSDFRGRSRRGIYGDTVEELDWSVGRVVDALSAAGVAKNTLIVFTSDNGPWLIQGAQGGSAGLLRDGKGSTWEGGMRVPCIVAWPGRIPPGTSHAMAHAMDIFPTAMAIAGGTLTEGRVLDGIDLTAHLTTGAALPERPFFFYRGATLFACRMGDFKAHFLTQNAAGQPKPTAHEPPLLYNLAVDPSEQHDVASTHPEVLRAIRAAVARHRDTLTPGTRQVD